MKIPFNMDYHFNSSLHEVPDNQVEFRKGIEFIQSEISQSGGIKKARFLSELGVLQRIVGKLHDSLDSLNEASELIQNQNSLRLKRINDLRIAQTLQFLTEFDNAENQYQRLEKECRSNPDLIDLLDFVLQHSGKCHFDQEKFNRATALFTEAMELRMKKGDEGLIQSTQFALDRINEILAE